MRTDWFVGVHVLEGLGLGEGCGGWEEGAGIRKGPGAPRGAADPLGFGGGSRGGPHPCLPNPPQDADDKWACVLGRQRRRYWGHRSPSPGSHTAVPPGATTQPTSQSGPWTREVAGSSRAPPSTSHLGVCVRGEPSQQLLTPRGPRGCPAPTQHACAQAEDTPRHQHAPYTHTQKHIHLHTCPSA